MDDETRKIPSHEVTYGKLRDMILYRAPAGTRPGGRFGPDPAILVQA